MKKHEAIEILKGNFLNVTLGENESHSDAFTKAFNIAIEALEKQVPKKLTKSDITGYYGCPACKRIVESVHDYCWHCGQKIDWDYKESED